MDKKLTEKQQKLVEENHNLIYGFANKMHLPLEEYYDLLAIGLCKAAQIFEEDKGAFSTVAYCCMKNELALYLRHIQIKSAIPKELIFSYDASCKDSHNGDTGNNVLETLASKHSVEDLVVNHIVTKEILTSLKDEDKFILQMIAVGMSQRKIAEKMGYSAQWVNNCIKRIRRRCISQFGSY